jgi:hypothetical protein
MLRKTFLFLIGLIVAISSSPSHAAPRPHIITYGKWFTTQWPDADSKRRFDLKVRPLIVDTRVKEYTTGTPHELTDRLFVVRRAFRLNDALPGETGVRWQWQRGGWLLVDRLSGRVAQLTLPDFDPFYSTASWYRDYIAYCGVSEDGKRLYAMVMQVGRRRPVLKRDLGEPAGADEPDSECPAPTWERSPARVTFRPDDAQKLVFSIRGHTLDVINDADDEGEE